jgi:UPF0271 protein
MEMKIEINCDMGERQETHLDLELMPYVNAVNISCGYHAGNLDIMRTTVKNAQIHGLKIGAHPGFKDPEHFGRRKFFLSKKEIYTLVRNQLEIFSNECGNFSHVKPHGALYNMASEMEDYAEAIARAVLDHNPHLELYGLAGSISIKKAEEMGLKTREEGFADRAYLQNGVLAPREMEGSVLTDPFRIEKQFKAILEGSSIPDINEKPGPIIRASTLCIHSDSPNALNIAKWLNELILRSGSGDSI